MAVHNADIADLFDELADLLEIEDANPFRVRAYRYAASTIREYPKSLAELVAAGEPLPHLPGIGKDLAAKIAEIAETGKLEALEQAAARTPRALSELMKIRGLGAKRVKTLYSELSIRSLEDLERAVRSGKLQTLRGFGPKTEALVRDRLARMTGGERIRIDEAERVAAPLVAYLEALPGVETVTVAGSFRRRRETVGDLDVLVAAKDGTAVIAAFTAYGEVAEVVSEGTTRSTVRLDSGLQVDLRVVPRVSYGAALLYFTGSKQHNIELRKIALRKDWKINEYGLYEGERRIAGRTEHEIYERLGLAEIAPELRENRGEIEAARRGRLPELVTLANVRGDLHCHTRVSDGRDTLEQMARAAAERGYAYLAITDHSPSAPALRGLDARRLRAQSRTIDALNAKLDGIVILKSAEVDILADGSLDLPDDVLAELDFVVCSIHEGLELPRAEQTERLLRAMDNRYCDILGHPLARLVGEREPIELDLERVLEAAKARGCVLELNANPKRLDLNDEAVKLAKSLGIKLALGTDAHSCEELDYMRYGIDQARRGWLEPGDLVNTLPLTKLEKLFAERRR